MREGSDARSAAVVMLVSARLPLRDQDSNGRTLEGFDGWMAQVMKDGKAACIGVAIVQVGPSGKHRNSRTEGDVRRTRATMSYVNSSPSVSSVRRRDRDASAPLTFAYLP